MLVHTGQKTKENVFNEKKELYNGYFKKIGEQEDLIKSSNNVIQQNFAEFQKLKQSIQIDPTRQAFFQRIDLAIMCQSDLENMLSQGQDFYQRLVEHLTVLKQNIQDFKMGRTMQANDLLQKLGKAPMQTQ